MADEPERMDAPNQEVVRPDGSGPADVGEGGSGGGQPKNRGGRPRKDAAADRAADEPAEKAKAAAETGRPK
jgi:hypothetical protein